MDRFIALSFCHWSGVCIYLKSNMDRFIGKLSLSALQRTKYLKSNMDRFIADENSYNFILNVRFKIQYG